MFSPLAKPVLSAVEGGSLGEVKFQYEEGGTAGDIKKIIQDYIQSNPENQFTDIVAVIIKGRISEKGLFVSDLAY